MACEYCRGEGFHFYRCPNYQNPKTHHKCIVCNEGIFNGEEYIVNDYGEYAHYECVDYARKMAEFLGYDIKEMYDGEY